MVNPFSVDDFAEVVGSGFTSTKYTQTVSTIRKTSWGKIVSNPHPDIVQEALSKKKEKIPQLSQLQKAIRWDNSDKKDALQKYKSVNHIELPFDESELPEDTATAVIMQNNGKKATKSIKKVSIANLSYYE